MPETARGMVPTVTGMTISCCSRRLLTNASTSSWQAIWMRLLNSTQVGGVEGTGKSMVWDRVHCFSTDSPLARDIINRSTRECSGLTLQYLTSITRESRISETATAVLLTTTMVTGIFWPGTQPACGRCSSSFKGSVLHGPQQKVR